MHTTELRWASGAFLLAVGLLASAAVPAVGKDKPPVEKMGLPKQTTPSPIALTPEQEETTRKLVEEEVKKRLDEEAKVKGADKEKEESPKQEPGFEIGKYMEIKGLWNNGLQWSSADSSFRLHLGGR